MGEALTVLRVGQAGGVSGADVLDVADIAEALTTLEERSVDGVFLPAARASTDVDILREHHPTLPIVIVGERPGGPSAPDGSRALRTAAEGEAVATLETMLAERDAESALREHRGLRRAVGRIAADTAGQRDSAAIVETTLEHLLSTERFRFGFGAQRRDDGSVLELPGTDALAFQLTGADAAIDEALSGSEPTVVAESDPPAVVVPIGGDRGVVLFTADDETPDPGERSVLEDLARLLQGQPRDGDVSTPDGDASAEESETDQADSASADSERASDVLVEMLAHELRSPLDLGRGRLEMAVEDGEEEDIERAIETFDRIEDVVAAGVSLARLETDDERSIDVVERARSVWSEAATAGADLDVEDAERIPSIEADPALLDRLLSNLFRNAVEHGGDSAPRDGGENTPAGPTVRLGPLADDVGFYVSDDGDGVDPTDRDRILEPGVSLDNGTGYGLAIVDRVARAHDWDVAVEESAAGGARFEIQTG